MLQVYDEPQEPFQCATMGDNTHTHTMGPDHRVVQTLEFAPDRIERWTNCYKRDDVTRSVAVGVAMGSKLFSR